MNRLRYILPLLLAVLISSLDSSAQSLEHVEQRNMWNLGRNVTGLLRDTITTSYAELYSLIEGGEYRNYSDASQLWSAGAKAKTIKHTDKLSMIGAVSYEHSEGEQMCGSMFISPGSYPFDILEFTPGDKTLQSYYFMGGVSSAVNERLNIGVKGEVGAQNYAKFKDLRHYNYRMELSLTPSVSYRIGQTTLGASYIYSRSSETIRAQEVGSTAAAYYAFLDKGLMSGAYETWGGTGIHLDESGIDGFPVRENIHGAALQADWNGIYGEVEYLYGVGEVGEKLTYWFNFPSRSYSARLGYSRLCADRLHTFMVEMQLYTLENRENVIGSVTENGVTTDVIYGSSKIFACEQFSLMPRYKMFDLSGGELEIGANYYHTFSRATQMYPYVEELTAERYQGYISGVIPHRSFEFSGKILYSTGNLLENSYSSATDIDAGDKPYHLEEYYNIGNEYLTATSLCSSIAVRYNHPCSYYAQVGAHYTKPFNLKYIDGHNRWRCTLSIGYKF